MLCKGILIEQNKERACWLPAQESSQFQLCRRCHFHKVTSILDSFTRNYTSGELHPPYELLLNDTTFLNELLHPAREQALLNCLSSLFIHNKIQFQHVIEKLKKQTVFSILLTKRIESHTPCSKCKFYMYCMEDPTLYTSKHSCWNCWSCLSLLLRRKKPHLIQQFSDSFLFKYRLLTAEVFQEVGSTVIADIFASLHFLEKRNMLKIWIEWLLMILPLEEFKRFLLVFLQQPCMHLFFIQGQEIEILPLPFQVETVVQEYKQVIKKSMKQRMNILRQDLVEKTWHPRRLFPWCLDIEEWKDFGVSHNSCHLVYEDFLLNSG